MWLVKVLDELETDPSLRYAIQCYTDKRERPRGLYEILQGDFTKNPKVVFEFDEDEQREVYKVIENVDLKEVEEKWEEIDTAIVMDAAPVFKTTNRESMLAFVDSYQLRIMAPEKYSSLGLLAEFELDGFLVGDALDTPEKVKAYHIELLFDLDTKRNQKIADYLVLKASKGL